MLTCLIENHGPYLIGTTKLIVFTTSEGSLSYIKPNAYSLWYKYVIYTIHIITFKYLHTECSSLVEVR